MDWLHAMCTTKPTIGTMVRLLSWVQEGCLDVCFFACERRKVPLVGNNLL